MANVLAHLVLQKVDLLKHFHPEWVDGGPGQPGPLLSKAARAFMISGVIRDMASLIRDEAIGKELRTVAQKMAREASSGLLAGWEEGDDLCPPWRWPFPRPKPGPDPWWFDVGLLDRGDFAWLNAAPAGALDQVLAFGIRELAAMATDGAHARALSAQAEKLATAA